MNLRNFAVSGFISSEPKFCEKDGVPIFGFTISHQEKNEKGEIRWFNFPVRSFKETALNLKSLVAKGCVLTVEGRLQSSKSGQLHMNIETYKIHSKPVKQNNSTLSAAEHAEWIAAYDNAPEANEEHK